MALDLHVRRVIGGAFSDKPDAELAARALDMAYKQRGKPQQVMFHSVQDTQYASHLFRQRLWRYRIRQSMSQRGNCWDNAPMERLFRSLKTKWIQALTVEELRRLHEGVQARTVYDRPSTQPGKWFTGIDGCGGVLPLFMDTAHGGALQLTTGQKANILKQQKASRLTQ